MSAPLRPARRQRGLAIVEFALILPALIALVAFPLFFSRYFMHYTVAQKAARDVAVYMARLPVTEVERQSRALAAFAIANEIISAETRGLRPGSGGITVSSLACDQGACGAGRPRVIGVTVRMVMFDDFFPLFTASVIGTNGIPIFASASMNYIGQ